MDAGPVCAIRLGLWCCCRRVEPMSLQSTANSLSLQRLDPQCQGHGSERWILRMFLMAIIKQVSSRGLQYGSVADHAEVAPPGEFLQAKMQDIL
ncbi:hypothetical protein NDU88_004962 [Pleurodeles waltl]|uniref:Uncharacterized protein n=1 Tax=Pleurodeles waltl TaxID=8319 RepID=A0AAV7V2J9_PLEWA|nr:hypothetical protein NDU88_004962 [Pleurodeles waltl]